MTDRTAHTFNENLHDDLMDSRMDRILDRIDYDRFDGHGEPVTIGGVDPSETLMRNGSIRYLLYPGTRELSIRTRGDVDHRYWQENGGENHCKSMFFYNERVWHDYLPPNPPAVPGQVWDFSDSNSFSVDLIGAIVAGGHNYDGTTSQANADINVTASNTFILGEESSSIRHFLFYGYPNPTHPDNVRPTARRAGAKGLISVIRESNNQTLHSIAIPASKFGSRQLQIVPIQQILRQNYPGLSVGESIRIEYNMTSFGRGEPWTTCPDQPDSISCLVGALYGFAVLPLVRTS